MAIIVHSELDRVTPAQGVGEADSFGAMSKRARATLPGGPFSRSVAAVIRVAFEESKLTQAALGDAIGQSQSQMSKYLTGERSLNLDEFAELCSVLGLDPVEVVREALADD